jgi:hypothetical protein
MNILILLKNSPLDASIVNFTASVFSDDSVKLHLLNLVEVNGEVPTKPTGEVLDVCTEFDLSGYHTTAEKNRSYLASIENELISSRRALVGDRIKLIQHCKEELSIDLVVGGAHKTSHFEDIFVHTFASSIIEKVDVPFLSIKCNRDEFKPTKIGIIRDYLHAEVENLKVLKDISELHNSEIVLIKIKTVNERRSNEDIENQMRIFAELNKLNAETLILNDSDKESGVKSIAQEHLVDLIALEKSHRMGLSAFLKRDENASLVNHIFAPILIY